MAMGEDEGVGGESDAHRADVLPKTHFCEVVSVHCYYGNRDACNTVVHTFSVVD